MHADRPVFSQLMAHLPRYAICRCVARYQGGRYVPDGMIRFGYFAQAR